MVFGMCHIMSHVGKAVDIVSTQEDRALRDEGDESLTGTNHLWLNRRRDVPVNHEERLTGLLQRPLQTARA
jgi:Transposase